MGHGALILMGSGRGWRGRPPVAWGLIGASLCLLTGLMHWPALATPLGLTPLPLQAWGVALACSLASVIGVTVLTRRILPVRA